MIITNNNVLDIFQNGNKEMEKVILDAGITEASMKETQRWEPPMKIPKDYMAIGKILQTFVGGNESRDIEQEVKMFLSELFKKIGIDRPSNYHDIQKFIVDDVSCAADPEEYHDGDMAIAFRRFIESAREEV